mgnify:CR=1 FL=1
MYKFPILHMPVVNNNNRAEFVTVPTLEQAEETFGDVLDSVIDNHLYVNIEDFGFHRIDIIEALRVSAGGSWSTVVYSDDNAIEILEDYAVTCTSAKENFDAARTHDDFHYVQSDDEEEMEAIKCIGGLVGVVHNTKAEELIGHKYNDLTGTQNVTVIFRKD